VTARKGHGSVRPVVLAVVCTLLASAVGCVTASKTGGAGGLFGDKGAPWTIRCIELSGPDRVGRAERFAQTLRQTPDIRAGDVFYHDEPDGFARVYYGAYRRRTDLRTGRRDIPAAMRSDLDLIRQLGDPASGQRYFFHAIPVHMPQPDVGKPQWRLTHARGKYSLQVAAFEPTDDFWEFKKAAADYCAYLREEGFEAYYHHSPVSSVVTVGSFGPEAVIQRREGGRYVTQYSAEVAALQEHELLKHNLLNGHILKVVDENGRRVPVPSRLVEIPRVE